MQDVRKDTFAVSTGNTYNDSLCVQLDICCLVILFMYLQGRQQLNAGGMATYLNEDFRSDAEEATSVFTNSRIAFNSML